VQYCADDDNNYYYNDYSVDCPDGYRTCTEGNSYWCCDRSSKYDRCGDDVGVCKTNTSKKTKKTVGAVVIAISIIIPLAIIAGIIACCFCCVGCPGYKCMHPDNKQGQHNAVPTAAPGVVVVQSRPPDGAPTVVQGVVMKEEPQSNTSV